jgi:hypothetical protein
MEFKMRDYKKSEFNSILVNIANRINRGGELVEYHHDQNTQFLTAIIPDVLIMQMSSDELESLKVV